MSPPVGRRAFVVGGAAFLAAAACGGNDSDDADRPAISVTSSKPSQELNMLVASVPILATAPDERVALMVLRGQEPVPADAAVEVLFGQVQGQSVGQTIGPFKAERHGDGLTRPYYLVRATFPAAGNYAIQGTVDGEEVLAALEAVDPAKDGAPRIGQPLLSTKTPTKADPMGLDPLCTATPACPLHEVSLDAALAEKKPVALLFGTPAFCKTDTCGPVLDVLIDEMKPYADRMRFIHVEIYTDRTLKTTTAPVQAYNLPGEPFLFLAGADGVVRERIPGPYDRAEVRAALAKTVA
jgi:hypothetical protein